MHLTNYSINKMNEEYVHPTQDQVLLDNQATKRTLESLYHTLADKGIDIEKVKENIHYTCRRVMEIYGPLIEHQTVALANRVTDTIQGKPFQILGLDLLIDSKLKAWVLEVNDHPSLNIYFDTSFMEAKRMDETDICQVDLYVKKRLVTDTLNLAKKKMSEKREIDQFHSLTRLHPHTD